MAHTEMFLSEKLQMRLKLVAKRTCKRLQGIKELNNLKSMSMPFRDLGHRIGQLVKPLTTILCRPWGSRSQMIFVMAGLLLIQLTQGCGKDPEPPSKVEAAKERLKNYKPTIENGCQCFKDCVNRKGCHDHNSRHGNGFCTENHLSAFDMKNLLEHKKGFIKFIRDQYLTSVRMHLMATDT
ncbi:hypothetical protein CAPTEDRAFT_213016 [Capitella teleta]|uniref:Uncharacterized protein n=1 Tax=Capitella teleta TaxID=283909 RepID=R7VD17_CAPTE|nr:hypothetical protein CAPTEDRAFT_213016 [Capitella teleta]|eukprot:ELU14171.1 hypothetical protein CAPTEDRAFT_213016 [Capitella teleta]